MPHNCSGVAFAIEAVGQKLLVDRFDIPCVEIFVAEQAEQLGVVVAGFIHAVAAGCFCQPKARCC